MGPDLSARLPDAHGGDSPEAQAAAIRELRRRVYSREAALDPEGAAADRALLDDLESRHALRAGDTDVAPEAAAASDASDSQAQASEIADVDGEGAAPTPIWRNRRVVAVAVSLAALTIVGSAVGTVAALSTTPSATSLSIFDRPGVATNQSPLPPDFAIGMSPSATIDELRGLGTFEGWSVWAVRLGDKRICLIATNDSLRGATCSTPAQFATTGLSLAIAGPDAATGNAAPVRDLSINWGPDGEKATTVDAPR